MVSIVLCMQIRLIVDSLGRPQILEALISSRKAWSPERLGGDASLAKKRLPSHSLTPQKFSVARSER